MTETCAGEPEGVIGFPSSINKLFWVEIGDTGAELGNSTVIFLESSSAERFGKSLSWLMDGKIGKGELL